MSAMALAMVAGCTFYTDSINGEPDAHIEKTTPGPHHINETVTLSATSSHDPNDGLSELSARWIVHECNDDIGADCPTLIDDLNLSVFAPYELTIERRAPYRVTLEISDDRGALDIDSLVVETDNRPPALTLDPQGCVDCGAYTLGTWIDILAAADDPDGDAVALSWELFAPDESVAGEREFAAVTGYPDPAYRLVPDVVGLWTVRVTATDSGGTETVVDQPILVEADQPPCIANIEPAIPGATYVVGADEEPRRFAALSVTDDLDPFPAPVEPGPFHGETTFRWFIASPDTSGAFVEVTANTSAAYLLDPAGFSPGDLLQVRVEVADRVARAVSCPVEEPTCSVDEDTCNQRISWGVEIR